MLSQIPEMPKLGLTFCFKVGSQTAKDFMYKAVHDSLESHLRKRLHNSNIKFRIETTDEVFVATGLPFTSKDKYIYMLEKNPTLALLRDAFDLETD